MQNCPTCNTELKLLFTSTYCPNCDNIGKKVCTKTWEIPSIKEDIRVSIAKDVLSRLHLDKIRAQFGKFVAFEDYPDKKDIVCEVCAIGSLVVSCAEMSLIPKDSPKEIADFTYNGDSERRFIHTSLGSYFDPEQLDLIEAAFENTTDFASSGTVEALDKAVRFGCGNAPRNILEMIMNNIIKNQGIFVP